jgi:N-acetylglucosaminyl-diphospho-decaprenol L-rhamnosyltransferase
MIACHMASQASATSIAATGAEAQTRALKTRATAVIVTYQSRYTVGPALEAAREVHRQGLMNCIVVDNASTDGTADFIANRHPWVNLIRSGENLGFGRGCNLAFQHVTTPYLILINPDAVLDALGTKLLIDFLDRNPAAGIAAPAMLDDDGQPHFGGAMVTPKDLLRSMLGRPQHAYPHRRPIEPGGTAFRTSWVCGAVMVIRSDLFRSLGGFDERFFLYFEETDLCRRAAERGAEIWAIGEAVAYHSGSASAKASGDELYSACIATHYLRSRRIYLTKHFGLIRGLLTDAALRGAMALHRLRRGLRQMLSPSSRAE